MYKVFRIYEDIGTICESSDDIVSSLNAAAIYLMDPDCIGIKIWRAATGEIILDYWREHDED